MAIIDLDDLLDDVHYVYNSLKEVVAQVTKKLQLKVDSEAEDPDADNSNLPFTLPYQYYATHYTAFPAKTVTHDYDPYTSGEHKTAFAYQLTLNDNVLTMSGLTAIGMVEGSGWHLLSPEQREASYNQMKSYFEGQTIHIISNYPDNATLFSHTSGYFQFFPTGKQYSDIYYKYQTLTGDTVSGGIATMMYSADYTPYIDDSTGYLYNSNSFNQLRSGQTSYIQRQPFEGVFGNLASARAWVSANGATHNYEQSYLVYGGSMTVLYGDNYIIYVVPSGVKVTYNLMKNITQNIATTINSDNPDIPVIKVPTYDENKYGPEPEPGDYTDDNFGLTTTGFSSNIGGAGNYWLMSLTNLAGFISDFKTTAPAGAMISQNILSCYVNALNYEWETGQDNIVIHAAGAQNTPYKSTSQYDYIYQYNPHVVVGQYKVPRVTETFYDFNPYSTYELYIPFCGWIGLPDTVAGRNIRVYMDFDVATMSCKAYVMVEMEDGSGDTICGEITGSFGAPCPIQVIEGGLYKQAMINSGLQIASGVVSGLMGGAFGGPVGASMLATGGMNAVQGLASAYMAGNTNYGQTIGRAGDTSGLCGGHYCYIKITHPVIDEVVDTETFGHTTGYPCYMESELTDLVGTGFTVCLNPHVHVNCTQSEKDEIKQLLESGVIL